MGEGGGGWVAAWRDGAADRDSLRHSKPRNALFIPPHSSQSGGGASDASDDAELAGAFSTFAKEYGVDTLGLLSGAPHASPAEQLRQPRAAPATETVVIVKESEDDDASLPQFAVFGPQRGSQKEGNTVVVTDPSSAPPVVPVQRAADAIVIPLSDAARTQIPHVSPGSGGAPQMDARWWGVVAAVALCTLLCAVVFLSWCVAGSGWSGCCYGGPTRPFFRD